VSEESLGVFKLLIWPGTLLNGLFGTTFDVMDETRRQQTTKGEPAFQQLRSNN
jgi:hypothetical protein